jgi:uncharacterized protein YecE (DUF72 family)
MEFGKVTDLQAIDFTLPPDHPIIAHSLQPSPHHTSAQIYVGCPVWANKHWLGTWYPASAKEASFLSHYVKQFNSIELNSTHYHLPDIATIQRWKTTAPRHFRFCPKVLQEISHYQLFDGTAAPLLAECCARLNLLEEKLGCAFLQLPSYFTPDKLPLLENLLQSLPPNFPLALEIRHPACFKPEFFARYLALLQHHQLSTVITDVAGRRDALQLALSSPTALIRFVGNSLHHSDFERLDAWVERIANWLTQGLQQLYFFLHQPDNTLAPELAVYFIERLNQRCNLQLAPPQKQAQVQQGKLF